MYYIGIDIGSTSSKVAVMDENSIVKTLIYPTGWSSVETANNIKERLEKENFLNGAVIVATGYGRVSVPYADKTVTEITCHGKGAYYLAGESCTVIDIGGQDTKIISVEDGNITNFTMNDKCAAGTGRFLELMSSTLGLGIMEMSRLSEKGKGVTISSMCTVFAESEVISLIGSGEKRENIAWAVIDSITSRVKSMCQKHGNSYGYFLTGGLCDNEAIIKSLTVKLGQPVRSQEIGRYAGAIGASLIARGIKK